MGLRRLLRLRRRRAVRPRGLPRLAFDLDAVAELTGPRRPSARARLQAELGVELVRDLDRLLELDGGLARPVRPRRRLHRAA